MQHRGKSWYTVCTQHTKDHNTLFSRAEKQRISQAVEDVLREINHPEMDVANIRFNLHVFGAEEWSYADIHQNTPETRTGVDPNPWNEVSREILNNAEPLGL